MDEIIQSVANEQVKKWGKLHQKKYRDEYGLFLVEGEHLTELALTTGCVEHLLILSGLDHIWVNHPAKVSVSQAILDKLSQSVSGTNIIAVCRLVKTVPNKMERVIVLDSIQDPGNLGAIIRCAVSFGYDCLILSPQCVDAYNDKCIRSTQGACFMIPIVRQELTEAISFLKQQGVEILVTALTEATPLKEVNSSTKSHALVLGNEGSGVSSSVMALADQKITIEMKQFESLNVAVAAGICMYMLQQE